MPAGLRGDITSLSPRWHWLVFIKGEGEKGMSLDKLVEDAPFDYRETKSGLVQVSYRGKVVTTLTGKAAAKLLTRLATAGEREAQLAMAKVTGHFKQGNERAGKMVNAN